MKTQLKIEGMSCGHCVAGVTRALQSVNGVEGASVTLQPGLAIVEHGSAVTAEALVAAVEDEGYTAQAL